MSKVHEDNAGYVGVSYEETQDPYFSYNKLSLPLSESQLSAKQSAEETFTVTVANSKFVVDGVSQASLSLAEGGVYKFDQSDSSNTGHPLRFSYTEDGTNSDGVEMTLGVTVNGTPGSAGAYTKIVVPFGLHDLYYYCSVHSGYGGSANVAKDALKFTTALPILKTTDAFGETLGTGNNEDPFAANLVLAISGNGSFQDVSATIKGSGTNKTVTANNNATTSSTEGRYYGGGSLKFDGAGDYFTIPNSSDFAFGLGDYTVEFWIKTTDTAFNILDIDTGGGWSTVVVNNNAPLFWQTNRANSNLYQINTNNDLIDGNWHHVAYVRKDGIHTPFLDGQPIGNAGGYPDPTDYTTSTGNLQIGRGANGDLDGYLQDIRIYKGVAKYTTPFTTGSYGMDVLTYRGNSSTQTISGLNFQPDFVYISARDGTGYIKYIFDSVRGANKALATSHTQGDDAEATLSDGLTSFNSNGFALGGNAQSNENNRSMVAWCWKAGGAPTTDNVAGAGNVPTAGSVKIDGANMTTSLAGTIPATRLTASTKYGFSIVEYEGNGTSGSTIAHGITNATPKMVWMKNRDTDSTDWRVYTTAIDGSLDFMFLNLTDSKTNSGLSAFTNTTFKVGSSNESNGNNDSMIAYCWSEVSGFSKFNSYSGNGSTQVITTGFKPAWIMFKRYDSNAAGADWYILDSKRFSGTQEYLLSPNNNVAETGTLADYVVLNDDGFTLQTGTTLNGSGRSYIYAAFAESAPGDAAFESLVVDQLDLKDRSGNSNNASNEGATWQTSVSKFYGGATDFDGSGGHMVISHDDSLQFGTGDFTVEGWFYSHSAPSTYPSLISKYDQSAFSWIIRLSNTNQIIWYDGTNTASAANAFSYNSWNHFAAVRSAGTVVMYLNGSPVLSRADSNDYNDTNKIHIARQDQNNTANWFDGSIQDVRIYKGIAKYTSSFSPPERSVQGTARRYPSGVYVVS